MFQVNKDIDMENLMVMQDKLVELYNDMYGFDPDFGTVSDWNDLGWVTRMYNDLLAEFHSLPAEFDLSPVEDERSIFWRELNRRQLLNDAERFASWASADIERGDLKSATFYQMLAKRALAGWESITV
jgi:hypothetical protein